jgi:cytochrome oxidase assembly protein ShyY1
MADWWPRRWPIIPTIIVAGAVATMIALGIWQAQRMDEKDALIARFAANQAMSAEVAFPVIAPVPPDLLFRRSAIQCLEPVSWSERAGRAANGQTGYRHIAACRTGAEGPGVLVEMGVSEGPMAKPNWKGGAVRGMITLEPDNGNLFTKMFGKAPPLRAMLIADTPAPGLTASALPDPADTPNNHFAYMVQWFIFAIAAAVIYVMALRRRQNETA